MKKFLFLCAVIVSLISCKDKYSVDYVIYEVNPAKQNIDFYYKDPKSSANYSSIKNLRNAVKAKGEKLVFAINAGMFVKDKSPKGLYIEDYKMIKPLDTLTGVGNFYLQPNGVFYINKERQAFVQKTMTFRVDSTMKYATQSGPILIIDGKINPLFQEKSLNVNIRNGVGILENGNIVFVLSKKKVNFHEFAELFQDLGCKNALYLDGFVSRAYLPEKKWMQQDGDFGAIIAVTEK